MAAEPGRQKLYAVYFDTPDRDLLAADLSLRIRRSGRKRIQTIKSGSTAAGLFAREEWERPVVGNHPVLDDDTPVAPLLGEAVHALGPVFEVEVERLTWVHATEAATVELVLDRGAVMAAGRQSQVCELELELKHGQPQAIFALARRIAEMSSVRPGVLSKAERGYELLGPARGAVKAEKVRLDADVSTADAFHMIAGQCLRHYLSNEALLLAARDPEALHQARVALRRLRSAIAIFEPVLDLHAERYHQAELRWLTGVLGQARDLDVLLTKVKASALRERLQEARDQAYVDVGAALGSRRVRALLLDLTERRALDTWLNADRRDLQAKPAREFAEEALHKLRKRVKKRGASLASLSDESRHKVRKAAKRLRYGTEFFASLFPGEKYQRRSGKFAASLEALQDDLGELNDLAAAPNLLAQLGLDGKPGVRDLFVHRRKKRILHASQEALADLMGRKAFWS